MIALASNRIIELAVVEVLPTTHPIACNGWHSEPTYRHKSIGVHVQIDYFSFAYSALAAPVLGCQGRRLSRVGRNLDRRPGIGRYRAVLRRRGRAEGVPRHQAGNSQRPRGGLGTFGTPLLLPCSDAAIGTLGREYKRDIVNPQPRTAEEVYPVRTLLWSGDLRELLPDSFRLISIEAWMAGNQ